ncbi:hypothetical protein TRFO_26074 [Tritrichomonas foetus]|uniref:Uncharacterized protein n=1 Tax=Tritrichomonas foetus TaxID=1144522 RepID=A0A1J4K4V0_9EUKA|nr:hypothetical protein TRFO_26074 [Tritrichomonas foetus]|eukprot:OHT06002.1 hypothetical protein TRFO_26074 [Tritrichomonas foetus]
MIRRPLSSFEKSFATSNESVILGIQLSHPKHVPKVIQNFQKSLMSLHLRIENDDIVFKKDLNIVKMPNYIKNAYDAAEYMSDNNQFMQLSKSLGTIGVKDDLICVSAAHLCTDGKSLATALEHCMDDISGNEEIKPVFPVSVETLFSDFIKDHTKDKESEIFKKHSTLVPRKNYYPEDFAKYMTNRYFMTEIPLPELKCFDPNTKSLHHLTEYLWLSVILPAAVIGDSKDKLGCTSCVNLRPFITKEMMQKYVPDNNEFSIGNCFTSPTVFADNVDQDQTIGNLMKQLRSNFKNSLRNGQLQSAVKVLIEGFPFLSNDVIFHQNSNVGTMKAPKEVVDLHINNRIRSTSFQVLACLISYGKKSFGKDVMVPRFHYAPTTGSDLDYKKIYESAKFILKEVTANMTLRETYKQIQNVQDSIRFID